MTTTTPDTLDVQDRSQPHSDRLAATVARLRTRAGNVDTARVLLWIGGILMPLGVVLVILGWSGASHTSNLYEQIPYAISGGMLGIGVLFTGGFCYFAYWMTQLVHATRREGRETRAALERIEHLLAAAASAPAPAATSTAAATAPVTAEVPAVIATGAASADATPFVATSKGTMFHRPECTVVAGKTGLRHVSGDEAGMTPCKICNPLAS
jgi:hypothetical protein